MAAGGYKEFVAGETLDQDEINDYLMQGVLVFAGTAARGSAITAPVEGQFSFLKDSDALEFYDGTAWVALSTTPGAAVVSATTGSPTLGTVSSGGTTYNVYSFTGSGSITIDEPGFAELLLVGGGGGGGNTGGGGGAGGHLPIASAYVPAGTHTVTVGAGGGGGQPGTRYNAGQNGNASRLGSLYYAVGGGLGAGLFSGAFDTFSGGNGGSGGGASSTNSDFGSGGAGTPGQGNQGGNGRGENYPGAGGGGAGATGQNAQANAGGNGGAGLANSITGTSVTRAGGGGGGGDTGQGDSAGSGGTGGGGNGSANGNGSSGLANTGGGGGGSGLQDTGGSGGSGIVIVRVAV